MAEAPKSTVLKNASHDLRPFRIVSGEDGAVKNAWHMLRYVAICCDTTDPSAFVPLMAQASAFEDTLQIDPPLALHKVAAKRFVGTFMEQQISPQQV